MMADAEADDFTTRILDAINGMMLDMWAAVARHFEHRRRRQAQGRERAEKEGRYKGCPEDTRRNEGIAHMLACGRSYSQIQDLTKASGQRSPSLPGSSRQGRG
jgi:DNA invertase Pin-like site-specific DNA recombinase